MKLSMEMVADKLSACSYETNITVGKMEISGARLLASSTGNLRRDILYMAPASDYFDDDKFDDCVLCVHGLDWIKLYLIDINEAFAAVLDIFEEFAAWNGMLLEAAEHGRDMQHFIDISKYALPFPIYIADAMGAVVGYTREYGVGEVDTFWDSIVMHGRTHDKIFSESLTDDQGRVIDDLDGVVCNTSQGKIIGLYLMQNGEKIGAITIIEKGRNFSAGDCQLADVFRNAASSAAHKRDQDAELRTVAAITQDYLDGKIIDKECLWVHVCGCVERQDDDIELILLKNVKRNDFFYKSSTSFKLASAGIACFCMPYGDYILAVITCDNEAAFLAKVRKLLHGNEYLYGVSLPFSSVEAMPAALSQAALALKIGDKIPGTINKCVDYAYAYLLNRLAEYKGASAELIHPALTTLKKHDEKHRMSLYGTLYEYLRLERNVVATAKHLRIHRNSMIYRLRRMEELLNLNLDNINVRMYLMLSYHIDMTKERG